MEFEVAQLRRHYGPSPKRKQRLLDAIFNQLVADFNVEGSWRARTQFPQPLFANRIRKSPKAEY